MTGGGEDVNAISNLTRQALRDGLKETDARRVECFHVHWIY
jgi:hypothetical protein